MSTILVNANIYVERGNFQEAMLIENGIIKAVGTNAEIRAMAPAGCEEIDAEGRTVIPASTIPTSTSTMWVRACA